MTAPRPSEPRDLDVVQRWFQSVITHPGGVQGGVESKAAQGIIPLRRSELEHVVLRSKNLTAEERVSVCANAYYARLLDCLAESFPVLNRAVGEEAFADFAFGYLQRYPSQSYTLNVLGEDSFGDHVCMVGFSALCSGQFNWMDVDARDYKAYELSIAISASVA